MILSRCLLIKWGRLEPEPCAHRPESLLTCGRYLIELAESQASAFSPNSVCLPVKVTHKEESFQKYRSCYKNAETNTDTSRQLITVFKEFQIISADALVEGTVQNQDRNDTLGQLWNYAVGVQPNSGLAWQTWCFREVSDFTVQLVIYFFEKKILTRTVNFLKFSCVSGKK